MGGWLLMLSISTTKGLIAEDWISQARPAVRYPPSCVLRLNHSLHPGTARRHSWHRTSHAALLYPRKGPPSPVVVELVVALRKGDDIEPDAVRQLVDKVIIRPQVGLIARGW